MTKTTEQRTKLRRLAQAALGIFGVYGTPRAPDAEAMSIESIGAILGRRHMNFGATPDGTWIVVITGPDLRAPVAETDKQLIQAITKALIAAEVAAEIAADPFTLVECGPAV